MINYHLPLSFDNFVNCISRQLVYVIIQVVHERVHTISIKYNALSSTRQYPNNMGNRNSSRNKKYPAAYRKIATQKVSRVGKIHLSQMNHALTLLSEPEDNPNGQPMDNSSDLQSQEARVVDANMDDIELTSLDRLDGAAATVDYALYEYSFENLIFEGGGNKGLAYCGAIEVTIVRVH